ITLPQFQMCQDADAARPLIRMSFECEVHFLNAVTLRSFSKGRLSSLCASAEQHAIPRVHLSTLTCHMKRITELDGAHRNSHISAFNRSSPCRNHRPNLTRLN